MRKVNWGILGTGWVAQRFASDLLAFEGYSPVAIASRSKSRADELATRFGATKSHGSYEELLEDPAVEIVYVASSPHEHAKHSLAALAKGKHVVCEKPFATNASEAESVVAAARSSRLFCMEAMWTRCLPAITQVLRNVEAGEIGEPLIVTADFGIPVQEAPSNWLFDPKRGGGALLDRGVYAVSLAHWIFGKPTRVSMHADVRSGVDRTIAIILEFPGSRLAVLTASIGAYTSNEATISGSLGRIRLLEPFYRAERFVVSRAPATVAGVHSDLNPRSLVERLRGFKRAAGQFLPADLRRRRTVRCPIRGFGYGYEIQEASACLREGLLESSRLPLQGSLQVMEILDQLRQQLP